MKKILIALTVPIALSGCAKGGGKDVTERLIGMESYTADAEVTYISNKGEDVFQTVQYAKKDGRYCIDTLAPEEYAGTSLIYDGKLVWQKTSGSDHKIKVTSNSPERALLILYTFTENHERSMENATVTTSASPDGEHTVLEAVIPGDNRFLSTEKLWIDNDSGEPDKLVVYTAEGKEKIVVKFENFRYNENIDDSKFSVTQ